jgi:hypothetical protein
MFAQALKIFLGKIPCKNRRISIPDMVIYFKGTILSASTYKTSQHFTK